jgi:hypothetical protein
LEMPGRTSLPILPQYLAARLDSTELTSDQYRVRFSDAGDNGIDDHSENTFSVATLLSPIPPMRK